MGASPDGIDSARSSAHVAFETVGHGAFVGVDHVSMERHERSDGRLLGLVEAHIKAEGADLESYRDLAASPDPVTAELMRMVVEDEERHHDLMKRLVIRLQDDPNWESSSGALPAEVGAGLLGQGDAEPLRELSRRERRGARHLEAMALEAGDLQRPLAALFLHSMALDSQKHELVLGYVAGRMGQT